MSFWKRNIGYCFREIYSCNPILDTNLIFLKLEESAESSQAVLARDWGALVARLETEKDLVKRAEIEKEIRSIEDQMDQLESASTPLNPDLLNGLQNRINDIEFFLKTEKSTAKREELETNRINCIKALSERQKPVTNATELNDAVDQIESDQRLINSLTNRTIDEVDMYLFMNSDMLQFVDSKLEKELKDASDQMTTNDNAQYALGRTREKLFEDADRKWLEGKKSTEQEIKALENEEVEINVKIAEAETDERERLRQRLKQINSLIPHYQAQIKKGRSDWTHGQRKLEERKEASRPVTDNVDPSTLEKLQRLIIEAQGIRAERVRDYLTKEFDELQKQLADTKKRGMFSEETIKSIEDEFAEAKHLLIEQKHSDPKIYNRIARNFKSTKLALSTSLEEVEAGEENRSAIQNEITWNYKKFSTVIDNLTPQKIAELKEIAIAEQGGKGWEGVSPILKKELNTLDAFIDPEGEIRQQMAAFGSRLENMDDIGPEELIAIKNDLNTLAPKLAIFENLDASLAEARSPENQDAKLAHKTIKELGKAKNPDDIRHILETNLGAEHLELVSHAEFEKEHRETTPEGDMVFEKEGSKWKIIIDETVFGKGGDLIGLKKQVTHELLHVEFERNSKIRDDVRKAYIEADPDHWKKIRAAFVKMENAEGKTAPDGGKWKDDPSHDDYILSEIYAMQNELNKDFVEERGTTKQKNKARLHNLILGAGTGILGNIANKAREYEDYNKNPKSEKEKFGYSGGADEDAGDYGGNASGGSGGSGGPSSGPKTKEHAVHKKNLEQIEHIRRRLEELDKSEHLDKVTGGPELIRAMKGFNDATEDLNEDLLRNEDSEVIVAAITSRNEKISKDLGDVEDKVGKAARKSPNTEMNILQKLWLNTTFLSMQDFVQMGTDVYEFISRRNDRTVADHAAKIGMALFGNTDMGREARAREQKAEADEVQEWQSRYENLDAWQLEEELESIANSTFPGKDQLKAILRILAKKGRFNLRNENLWKVLNNLQSSVLLKPGDQILHHNPILLRQKLHRALGEIYDFDEFPSLVRDQESAYQSEKGKYDTENNRTQNVLTERLDELLAQAREGEHVDPMQYESILEYGIKNGKSYAENVMFHLISGMARGLLAPDRGLALGEHLNVWPSIDWFSTLSPPMTTADWKRYAEQNFGRDFEKGSISEDGFGDEFKNWYWTVVQNNNQVIERVKKSVNERGWDHDWGRSIACLGDANTAKSFLSGRSGQTETKITGVSNAYVGAVQWLEENAKNPQYANKKNFARMAGWIAMSEGMLDGTAYLSGEKDINTRSNEAMNQDMPRERKVGNHHDANTRQHREITQQFLFEIDADFFGMLRGQEARGDTRKQELGIQARDHLIQRYPSLAAELGQVTVIDQIYNNLDLIISTMFSQMSEDRFQEILANIVTRI